MILVIENLRKVKLNDMSELKTILTMIYNILVTSFRWEEQAAGGADTKMFHVRSYER